MSDSALAPFKKVLIADRGEIALRVLRACREQGLAAVVIYSEPDRDSLPVLLADEAVCIGPGPLPDSYANVSRVLSAAEITHCDAVHPGYGPLATSPEFADACQSLGLRFIGPDVETMRRCRDKLGARELARSIGVPVLPGSVGEVKDAAEAARLGTELGYPLMVKAAAGSGPKNKLVIRRDRDVETVFRMAVADARAEFGSPSVYIEKFLTHARHIEIPLLADQHGNIVALPERDCSVQYRYRKLLEESPSPAISPKLRSQLQAWAMSIGRAVAITNTAVVEFLCDNNGNCGFIAIDSRLHIEHPLTEMITGLDIVRFQLASAAGAALAVESPPPFMGHAIECRINAEDPDASFAPTTGLITEARFAGGPGIRIDSYVTSGYVVSEFYDRLLAKLIAWAPNREQAISRMERALAETVLLGPTTNLRLHQRLLASRRFRRGQLAIGMLDEEF